VNSSRATNPRRQLSALVLLMALPFAGASGGAAAQTLSPASAPKVPPASPNVTAPAGYAEVSSWDAAIRELRRATRYNADGAHHPLLVALRQLKDPAMKPLFQSLVQGEHWSIQVDGILGLAELDLRHVVDPFLFAQLKGEHDRSTAIAAAVGLEMVDSEQAMAMLAWDDLQARDRVLLMAELFRRGGAMDVEKLTALAQHRNDEVAGVSAMILATSQKDPGPADAFRTRFGALSAKDRAAIYIGLASTALRFKLTAAAPFLLDQLQDASLPAEARGAGIATALTLSPDAGYAAWKAAVESDPSHSNRVRMAFVALAHDLRLPEGARGAAGDAGPAAPLRVAPADQPLDSLLEKLADAIDAVAGVGDPAKALPALVATRHRSSLLAVLEATKRVNTAAQRATYEAFADLLRSPTRRDVAPAVLELAIEALTRLGALDTAALARYLHVDGGVDNDDEQFRDFVLLALVGTNTKEAAEAARAAGHVASRRGSSIARVLQARFAEKLTADELKELGMIAAGGWRLDPALEIQAAWMYVKLSGRVDEAIAAILRP